MLRSTLDADRYDLVAGPEVGLERATRFLRAHEVARLVPHPPAPAAARRAALAWPGLTGFNRCHVHKVEPSVLVRRSVSAPRR